MCDNTMELDTEEWYDCLAYIISREIWNKDEIKVIDFGGEGGIAYDNIYIRLEDFEHNLNWNILELPFVVNKYKEEQKENVKWHTEIDDIAEEVDIIYSDASIECVLDWKEKMIEFCSKQPKYIFLHRANVGDYETFKAKVLVPVEHKYGLSENENQFQTWFINQEEFLTHMNLLGYSLIQKTLYDIHTKHRPLDEKVPETPKERTSLILKKN